MGLFRFLLAVSVLFGHSNDVFGFKLIAAETAVKSFYVISGFYMYMILTEKYVGTNGSYFLFIKNRFLKIYPLYWLVLLISIIYFFVLKIYNSSNINILYHFFDFYDKFDFTTAFILIFSNLFIFFQDIIMFLGFDFGESQIKFAKNYSDYSPPLYSFLLVPQAWTVCLEIYFYLLSPFLVKYKNKFLLLGCFIGSIFVKLFVISQGLTFDPWSYRFFLSELYLFILGCFSYQFFMKYKKQYNNSIFIISFLFMLLFTIFYSSINFYPKQIIYVFLSFFIIPVFFIKTKSNKFDRFLGELSYPIYILHILFINILSNFINKNDSLFSVYLLFITILTSILLKLTFLDNLEKIRQIKFN